MFYLLFCTLGCSSSDEPSAPYEGRSFMSEIDVKANRSSVSSGENFQLQCSIDATEFDVHGRRVMFSTDTLNFITPTAELYLWKNDSQSSIMDSIENPLKRYSKYGYTESQQENPFRQLRYAVGYALPPVIFRRGTPLTTHLDIRYPGKTRPKFAYGDTNQISFRMIFQIDSVHIDKDTIWHADNSVFTLLSSIGCEKRWYNINKLTDRRLIVKDIGWITAFDSPDAMSFNYNIAKKY